MSLVIDILLIAVAVLCIWLGCVRGFIKSVMSFGSLLIALLITLSFHDPLAGFINDRFVEPAVTNGIRTGISDMIQAGTKQLDLKEMVANTPEAFRSILERFNCDPEGLAEYYDKELDHLGEEEALDGLSKKIGAPTAAGISKIIAIVALFIVSYLILKLITMLLDLIFKLPILKTLNTFFGAVFGVLSALLTVWILSNVILGLIGPLGSLNPGLFNQSTVDNSILLKYISEHFTMLIH